MGGYRFPSCSGLREFSRQRSLVHDNTKIPEACEKSGLESLPGGNRSGRWERRTYKIVLSYHGGSFDGWQKQRGLNTVQGSIEKSLGEFVDEKKAKLLKDKSLPVEGCAVVAGRTDKGVTALGQVCSFYTWRKDVEPQHIELAVNTAAPRRLRAVSVSEVSRSFHPNFSAKWRRYLYIFPFNDGENGELSEGTRKNVDKICSKANSACRSKGFGNDIGNEDLQSFILSDEDDDYEAGNKQVSFEVSRVNQFLQLLEGKLLSYKMFARDTKASRNIGPPTECFLYHARASLARLKGADHQGGRNVMCIELVANRFLRKMVRVLVATSIREAAAGSEQDVLMKLMDSTCRRATAPPAPPDGLCLVDVGYTDFNPATCLIKKGS
ncbi:tRNA pseudouridine synthase A isoform X2 [Rhodamnia argentea]|uniref:tRNA pseudouridine synthase n=1 Tax=Rhodamnia argentea TaxID=178133 RepID=A0A8B8QNA6_9MYRT|nr:tRNA pseudouridine synthase A isoform X2 [Rhodamnia argentea]